MNFDTRFNFSMMMGYLNRASEWGGGEMKYLVWTYQNHWYVFSQIEWELSSRPSEDPW